MKKIKKINKYQELKIRMNTVSQRSLIIVDDNKIRAQNFAAAAAILKKIEKLEMDRESFFNEDQKLFSDWYQLTFREELKQAEVARERYLTLAKFHNDIVALSQMKKISMEKAYAFLKKEQQEYEQGDELKKKNIDKLRADRQEFAEKAMEEELNENSFNSFDDFDDLEDNDEQNITFKPDLTGLKGQEKEIYQIIKNLSPRDLKEKLSGWNGLSMFVEAFELASIAQDTELILTLWEAAPAKLKKRINTEMPFPNGKTMDDLILDLQMFHVLGDFEQDGIDDDDSDAEIAGDDELYGSDEFDHRDEKFYSTLGKKKNAKKVSVSEDTVLKVVYRKLARLIHPDTNKAALNCQGPDNEWYTNMWLKIQDAYQRKDVNLLKRLSLITCIRIEGLQSLTLDEIDESAKIFEEEHQELKRSLAEFQKHPAWRFSTKTNYTALSKKLRKEIKANIDPLLEDIDRLKMMHAYFEEASKGIKFPGTQRRPNKQKKSRKKTKKAGA
ncbi:MAG: hypothetical protein ACXVCP_18930 [Bdellovibrio sp.]